MSWSLNIGRVAGTTVRLHITFVLFLAWIFFASYTAGGATIAWSSLLFVVLLFLCVLLHEFGHIFAARAFGVATPYVTLLPIGGVAQLERIPEEPWQEFLIAIAGPAVNVVIAGALIAFAHAEPHASAAMGIDNMQIPIVDRLATLNLFLALFNLIPAFPMDGGRVLRAALASRMGYVRATERAAAIGQFTAFVLGFIGLFHNPILVFIAVFVYLAAASEAHSVALRAVSRGVPVSQAMQSHFVTLKPDAHIEEAVNLVLQTSQRVFPVVDVRGSLVGVLDRANTLQFVKQAGTDARVSDALSASPVLTVSSRATLEQALKLMHENSAATVGVVDGAGKLVGLVTSETIAEMMTLAMLRKDRPRCPIVQAMRSDTPRQ
ncbi:MULTISPECIES: site-2 protease family protein [unclassified Mesorhizobium]|uniref:site-2 protease family protein n=1 Tax=unclassified Mesorhizobium TaxID=325217 RepID=UPI00112BAB8D|nr:MULTISPECIES: site-2 protease family protein [unclassified Mesorhizobium]MBZ9894591.1 site-2 protease family protein [Mesorhizobium sp. BR1-1-6]TPN38376.1 CBS domain-containing protein [Mesorhizobium sp. B1-1-6]